MSEPTGSSGGRYFHTTQWNLLVPPPDRSRPSLRSAAATFLCEKYWHPIYWFLRSRGYIEVDAQDLTQSFFVHLLQSGAVTRATPEKGRFRSFLLGALKHFLAKAAAREQAAKRGGGVRPIELGALNAAEADALAVATEEATNAEERAQALALFERAWARLKGEYDRAGKAAMFDTLKTFCACHGQEEACYARMAEQLGRPKATVRSDVARLRAGYRRLIREEVARRVEPWAVEEELRRVVAAITARG